MNKIEKLKGICVRGGEHGVEMIQAFVGAGAMNNIAKHGGIRGDAYYFINKTMPLYGQPNQKEKK